MDDPPNGPPVAFFLGLSGVCLNKGDAESAGFDSKDIQADKSWIYTVENTGDFADICTIHPTMKAMLRVNQ